MVVHANILLVTEGFQTIQYQCILLPARFQFKGLIHCITLSRTNLGECIHPALYRENYVQLHTLLCNLNIIIWLYFILCQKKRGAIFVNKMKHLF